MPGPGIPGLVSIIVPCYNRADIVRDTIDSVLVQTYAKFEVIVIDDGSTDNTREVIATYNDSRIRYFYRENGGLSAARNSGLDAARGEFIAFLDSDDVWQSWKLSAQVEIFRRHPEVGLIWSDMSTFAEIGEILAERHLRAYYSAYSVANFEQDHEPAGTLSELLAAAPASFADSPYYVTDVFHHMFSGNLVHPSTAIVRRDRLRQSGAFEPEITGGGAEDYHFYFRICAQGPGAFLDAPTISYRVHSSQMSTCNRLHEARANLHVLMHWMQRRPPTLPQPVIRRSLASSHAWLGTEELNAGNPHAAIHHLLQSLRLHKTQPATIVLLFLSLIPQRAARVLRVLKHALLSPIARPLAVLAVFLSDDQNLLNQLADLFPSELASSL
jgi:glycosyltransferase involved in cell wall biosynthesis